MDDLSSWRGIDYYSSTMNEDKQKEKIVLYKYLLWDRVYLLRNSQFNFVDLTTYQHFMGQSNSTKHTGEKGLLSTCYRPYGKLISLMK